MNEKRYGLIEDLIELGAYIFGGAKVPFIPYNESGDWEKWLPQYEAQAENFETYCCTVFCALNQIETMENYLYNKGV